MHIVDVVTGFCFLDGDRKAAPDHGFRVNGRDEEREMGSGDVVGEVGVGEGAAGKVEEVAALAGKV